MGKLSLSLRSLVPGTDELKQEVADKFRRPLPPSLHRHRLSLTAFVSNVIVSTVFDPPASVPPTLRPTPWIVTSVRFCILPTAPMAGEGASETTESPSCGAARARRRQSYSSNKHWGVVMSRWLTCLFATSALVQFVSVSAAEGPTLSSPAPASPPPATTRPAAATPSNVPAAMSQIPATGAPIALESGKARCFA